MQRLISIALSSALALATLSPAVHAETATPGGPRAEDKATIKADREKIRQDLEQLKQDREQLQKDRMKLREDREKLRVDRRALHKKRTRSTKPAPKPQS